MLNQVQHDGLFLFPQNDRAHYKNLAKNLIPYESKIGGYFIALMKLKKRINTNYSLKCIKYPDYFT